MPPAKSNLPMSLRMGSPLRDPLSGRVFGTEHLSP